MSNQPENKISNSYRKYLTATAGSKAKQADADKLADEVNSSWRRENKERFMKVKSRLKK